MDFWEEKLKSYTETGEPSPCLRTPCYIVDEGAIIKNLAVLKGVSEASGCKILLAQKAFSMFALYPLIGEYLDGTAASGLFEARLGHDKLGKETHIFSPAYRDEEIDEITGLCSHIVFNSLAQFERYGGQALRAGCACGLRINPECRTQAHELYDPCAPGSRLGVTAANFPPELPNGISGLHFHTLCEQNADALEITLDAVKEKFGGYLGGVSWVNFGGGHHITRRDYDVKRLVRLIREFSEKYGVRVYLEPGEAVALNAGVLVASVLDIVNNGVENAILDASAACHMPDVLEMPYRPEIVGAGRPGEKAFTYRLGGPTCLAGDIIGDYSFDRPLDIGQKLIFLDMAHYTMVKNNTFNGVRLPSILLLKQNGELKTVRAFGYRDFLNRLS